MELLGASRTVSRWQVAEELYQELGRELVLKDKESGCRLNCSNQGEEPRHAEFRTMDSLSRKEDNEGQEE